MKSQIGIEFIRNNSEGRITHALLPSEAAPQEPAERSDSPPELVPVVVHVEKGALDELLHKSGH